MKACFREFEHSKRVAMLFYRSAPTWSRNARVRFKKLLPEHFIYIGISSVYDVGYFFLFLEKTNPTAPATPLAKLAAVVVTPLAKLAAVVVTVVQAEENLSNHPPLVWITISLFVCGFSRLISSIFCKFFTRSACFQLYLDFLEYSLTIFRFLEFFSHCIDLVSRLFRIITVPLAFNYLDLRKSLEDIKRGAYMGVVDVFTGFKGLQLVCGASFGRGDLLKSFL